MSTQANLWPRYDPQAIEPKWQQLWEREGLHLATETEDKPKFYCLDFFPYPSGEGLHVGHCRNYVPTDVISRYRRMRGDNVLHPMGWDAFGEPAEQYAISQGVHPRRTTDINTANFRRQMTLIGASYDWSREIDSSRPEFYRWTQWFFLLLYRRGLAYRDTNWQWWCPTCQTTLSSHETAGGICWRGHPGVTKREIPAWYFKITAYADELITGLDSVDWPENVKALQRNWIGRSEGAEVQFTLEGEDPGATGSPRPTITVFTTRPDTLFGVTYLVLAPEHPLVEAITAPEQRPAVEAYRAEAARLSEVDRMLEARPKTGVFTGAWTVHPLSGALLPVWVADYVLPSYGTGAVMGVPAHDSRDLEFAGANHLPVRVVIVPADQVRVEEPVQAYTGEGILVNSGPYDGLDSQEGAQRITADLQARGLGSPAVNYRMRDWLISRQRYWGTPIPILYCERCGTVPVPEEDLPVCLPEMDDFEPDGSGRSPLERLPEFVNTRCPACGGPAHRETDTMGGFACSSWYFLRFTSPHYQAGPFEPHALQYWMPVDLYVGGAEHAVLHLLYARFWTKVIADAGLVPFREPFARLINQGQMIGTDGRRMSKSRGNVIPPDGVVAAYGADALRIYELFMAPFEQDVSWSEDGINGARRFLNRVWSLYAETYAGSAGAGGRDPDLERSLHQTIRRASERIESFRFNTMVSTLMEFSGALVERQRSGAWRSATFHQALETLLLLLAPAAPHMAEEIWSLTGHAGWIGQQPWPGWDLELARPETVTLAVQINGKLRQTVELPAEAERSEVEAAALALPRVQQHISGQKVMQVFFVPGRLINFVTQK